MRRFILIGLLALARTCGGHAQETEIPAEPGRHLSLDEAIQLALSRNKAVKVDAYFRSIARANLLEATGHFDPSINFRRAYAEDGSPATTGPLVTQLTKTDDYALSLDGITPWGLSYSVGGNALNRRGTFNGFADNYRTFGGVTVTQPLLRGFGFGANLFGVRVAKVDRAISDWTFRQSVVATVTQVLIAYSEIIYARENLQTARRARDLVASLVESNERRFRAGTMSESDVLQARAQAAVREEGILFAERALRDSDNALRLLIGEDLFSLDAPLFALDLPELPQAEVNPAEDLKTAFDLRPDYQNARLGLTKNRASESLARNQLLPRVDVVASYGYNGLDANFAASRRMVRDEDNASYSAGVVVTVPLTFAEGRGRARAAKLTLRQSEADLERLAQGIALSVTNAAGEIETARKRVIANRRAHELASQALAGELKKLQAGTTSTFVVLNLQTNLTAIESNLSRALADQRRAYALYEREIGVTLQRHKIELKSES